jgi:hypothetical protein
MIFFLRRTIDFFFFFLSLWIYLWLAETSQQPISQTTWLKVTPHCNHCKSIKLHPLGVQITKNGFSLLYARQQSHNIVTPCNPLQQSHNIVFYLCALSFCLRAKQEL